ncbi:MAG: metalloprotease PmbA [Candidatus Eutrophobiaceae bacterium]
MNIKQLQEKYTELARKTLSYCLHEGASAAEVAISSGIGLMVGVRMANTEKIEYENDQALSLTVYMGQRKGMASSSDLSESSAKKSAHAASSIARLSGEDPYAGIAPAELMATEFPDLDLYHPWEIDPQSAIETCLACEKQALDFDPRIDNSDGAELSTYTGLYLYANSHGFCKGWASSSHSLHCSAIAQQDGHMQRDGWFSNACASEDLQSAQHIGREAGKRTVARLGARKLSTRNTPVLFDATVADHLFAEFIGAISGTNQYRRNTFLLNCLGQQIFPNFMRISEFPWMKRGHGSAPFDTNGIATHEKDFVTNGIVQSLSLGMYAARRLGMQPTGNGGGVRNLTIHPNAGGRNELIAQMNTGLWVTDMFGFGTNQLTGDYSRGASGFWVENGAILYPVEEITVAGNLREMYPRIVAVGNDVDPRGNTLTGSVLIDGMTVAGQ